MTAGACLGEVGAVRPNPEVPRDQSRGKLPLLALVELALLLVSSQPLEGEEKEQVQLLGFLSLRLLVEDPPSFISGKDSPWQA